MCIRDSLRHTLLAIALIIGPTLCGLACDNTFVVRISRKIRSNNVISQARPHRVGPMISAMASNVCLRVASAELQAVS